jgi:hypothetical protein
LISQEKYTVKQYKTISLFMKQRYANMHPHKYYNERRLLITLYFLLIVSFAKSQINIDWGLGLGAPFMTTPLTANMDAPQNYLSLHSTTRASYPRYLCFFQMNNTLSLWEVFYMDSVERNYSGATLGSLIYLQTDFLLGSGFGLGKVGGIRLHTGIVGTYFIGGDVKRAETLNAFPLAIKWGGGYDIGRMSIDISYQKGLTAFIVEDRLGVAGNIPSYFDFKITYKIKNWLSQKKIKEKFFNTKNL